VTENERMMRELFLPIAVLEHHQMIDPVLSTYDISDRLGQLWQEIQRDARADAFTLEPASVLSVNARVARSLGTDAGTFRNLDRWASFISTLAEIGSIEVGRIESDPSHTCSWIFSSLYWDHLTRLKLATAWFFVNAIRIQNKLPEYRVTMGRLGPFLESLSGSGPPIYDGQTFYPEDYSA
jgi:hypothetical protein